MIPRVGVFGIFPLVKKIVQKMRFLRKKDNTDNNRMDKTSDQRGKFLLSFVHSVKKVVQKYDFEGRESVIIKEKTKDISSLC